MKISAKNYRFLRKGGLCLCPMLLLLFSCSSLKSTEKATAHVYRLTLSIPYGANCAALNEALTGIEVTSMKVVTANQVCPQFIVAVRLLPAQKQSLNERLQNAGVVIKDIETLN
jgi:hypothetical protein